MEKILNLSLVLKEKFRQVERQEWSTQQYLTELFVQIGHLSDIILRQEYKLNKHDEKENHKALGDELCDTILNLVSVIESTQLDFDFSKIAIENLPQIEEPFSTLNHLSALAGQLTQIIEEKSNPEITKIVTGIVQDSYQLADFYKIEMDSAFENLYHESLIFIMRHSLPERIMVDLEEQYTEEQKYVELDSELVEFFIEKPKNIEVKDREPLPFLLVRPSAISRIEEIKQFLANKNIKVVVEGQINHFEELARRLYPVNPHDSNSYLWFILTRKEFPEKYDQGYVFFLDPSYIDSYEKVFETKLLLKQQLKNNRYLVEFEGQTRETDLHHIHSADSSNLKHESSLIRHYLELSK